MWAVCRLVALLIGAIFGIVGLIAGTGWLIGTQLVSSGADEPEPPRRPDLTGQVVAFEPHAGFQLTEGADPGSVGPATLTLEAQQPIEVPAGTDLYGGCPVMAGPDVGLPCLVQVAVDDTRRALWITAFASSGEVVAGDPAQAGAVTWTGVIRTLSPTEVVLRDGVVLPREGEIGVAGCPSGIAGVDDLLEEQVEVELELDGATAAVRAATCVDDGD